MKKYLSDALANITGTIVGGVILSILFFIFSDFIFTLPDLNGKWNFVVTVKNSNYKKYKGMKIYYSVFLQQQGLNIVGTGEKIQDILGNEVHSYNGQSRVQIKIAGYLDNNYIAKDKLFIIINEEGTLRESATFHHLVRFNNNHMEGSFASNIADSFGSVEWNR